MDADTLHTALLRALATLGLTWGDDTDDGRDHRWTRAQLAAALAPLLQTALEEQEALGGRNTT